MHPIRFETHPSRYVHWKLAVEGARATLVLDVQEDRPLRPGYVLKLNSYDLVNGKVLSPAAAVLAADSHSFCLVTAS